MTTWVHHRGGFCGVPANSGCWGSRIDLVWSLIGHEQNASSGWTRVGAARQTRMKHVRYETGLRGDTRRKQRTRTRQDKLHNMTSRNVWCTACAAAVGHDPCSVLVRATYMTNQMLKIRFLSSLAVRVVMSAATAPSVDRPRQAQRNGAFYDASGASVATAAVVLSSEEQETKRPACRPSSYRRLARHSPAQLASDLETGGLARRRRSTTRG